jgi:LmbE family N-acetylglucosaminyl deacetylase
MILFRRRALHTTAVCAAVVAGAISTPLAAQDRGAAAIVDAVASLGTTGRVLMIGAHPDDEDTDLIAWLARGRHIETAYLALTRGDGGQNLIGNELGEALGAIRTEELLAARRIDGGRQFFTRAYDFGFSKSPEETLAHWPRDSVLGDVVRVVRAYRPQLIVSVFSGTPRDGHGHHQLAGQLAREVYDVASDTVRFPVATHGPAWTPLKLYRAARGTPDASTLRINVGEYNPAFGRSYAEIAADSRSQHKSQGFGVLQRKGVVWDYVRREASRVGDAADSSMFDRVDTTWASLVRSVRDSVSRSHLERVGQLFGDARGALRSDDPSAIVPMLSAALRQLRAARERLGDGPPELLAVNGLAPPMLVGRRSARVRTTADHRPDIDAATHDALDVTLRRTERALLLASGVAIEATAARRAIPLVLPAASDVPDTLRVNVAIYNRGRREVRFDAVHVGVTFGDTLPERVAPDSTVRRSVLARATAPSVPWWRIAPRVGDLYRAPIDARDDATRTASGQLRTRVELVIDSVPVSVFAPVVNRFADPVKGELQRPVAAVPGITIGLEESASYVRAGVAIDRMVSVRVRSVYPSPQSVSVALQLPPGLRADSVERTVMIGAARDSVIGFRVRGALPEGRYPLTAVARFGGNSIASGWVEVAYDHIAPQLLFSQAGMWLQAVRVSVPPRTAVAYVQGVGDNGPAALEQLGVPVTRIPADQVPTTPLSRYTAVVVGPRAYDAQPSLVTQGGVLLDYARRGGTLVVQYGQYEMTQPGVMPYPITLTRPAARVTLEDAPVSVLAPTHPLLTGPNRITTDDFAGWVQERGLYMPTAFDSRYTPLLAMRDPGEPENRGALLTAPIGKGVYVYTTLSLFRQLPPAVPGAARLLVNLISARPARVPVP